MKTQAIIEILETPGRISLDIVRVMPKTKRIVCSFTFLKDRGVWTRHEGPGNNPVTVTPAVARMIRLQTQQLIVKVKRETRGMGDC